MEDSRTYRIMISGGGTGGHVYPAISIAQALESILSKVEILFVGAKGKMEMKKVPEAGYKIEGLWISGIKRQFSTDNLAFPFKLISSISKSYGLIKKFRPDAVVGVGGYASGPLLYAAARSGIPTLIQEQNSFAGLTNKWLGKKVDKVCVAYEGMEKYFPKSKVVITGNPVRLNIGQQEIKKEEAALYFNLDPTKKTILIMGGSLGAKTINDSIREGLQQFVNREVQVIWQTGATYYQGIMENIDMMQFPGIKIHEFITEMRYAYAMADLVISRAGALAIAELMLTKKAAILVPSPNVAEDHQTKNAEALVKEDAAVLVADHEAKEALVAQSLKLVYEDEKLAELQEKISAMAKPNAAMDIANEVMKLVA